MRLSGTLLQITKVTAAVSLCLGSSVAVASAAVRPAVKPVAAPAADAMLAALPVRAGAPAESKNELLGGALIPRLSLLVGALTVTAVVVGGDDDEPISPN